MAAGAPTPDELALRTRGPLVLIDSRGRHPRDVNRRVDVVDAGDEPVLGRCRGPVLDVDCGPARLVGALTDRDTAALGVHIFVAAVRATRRRDARALRHDLVDTAPSDPPGWEHAARLATVLLVDNSLGVGGSPRALPSRTTALLAPGGHVIVEAAGPRPVTDASAGGQLLDDCFVDRPGHHAPLLG